jgi:AraC-like DNA-binding protein
MIFKEFHPSHDLRPIVEYYLMMHFNPKEGYYPIKPYPTRIEQALVFFARGYIKAHHVESGTIKEIAHNALFGQQVSRLDFHPQWDEDFLMVMVVFKPGGLFRLLGIPSHELTAHFDDAESLLSAELRTVNDQVANALCHSEMIECVERYLIKKCRFLKREAHPLDRVAQILIERPQQFSLDWLSSQANLSARQFERKFVERIGIGPKLYSRISRFSQAFFFKQQHPEMDWLTIAIHHGYSDYAHLAKDFKQFAYTTPNVIIGQYAQRPEMVLKDEYSEVSTRPI